MKIRIPKLNFYEKIIFLILFLVFFSGIISIVIPRFSVINYSIDILLLILMLSFIKNYNKMKPLDKDYKKIIRWIVLFFGITTLASFFRAESFLCFLWAIRNNFRFFIFFVACILYLKKDYLKMFNILYWINFIAVLIEFFILGKKQDWLGGLFGIVGGSANAPLNLFLVITTIIFIVLYLNKKIKLPYLLITCVTSFLIAAFAELKFFYLEFALIAVLSFVISNFSIRKIKMIVFGIIIIFLGINFLYAVFPGLDKRFFSSEFIMNTYTSKQGYTGANDFNRLNFIEPSNKFFNGFGEYAFGLGLGNCEVIKPINKMSTFYSYYHNLHYSWFSSSFMYLETGAVGLILYFGFFIYYSLKLYFHKKEKLNIITSEIAIITSLMVCLIILYNTSMRSDEAFMIYFIMALPFIKSNLKVADNNE